MIEKNLEYLENKLKYTGFGEGLGDDLRRAIEKNPAEFTLHHSVQYGKDTVSAELKFAESKQQPGMYFFNSYNAKLEKEDPAKNVEQTFYVNYNNTITFKEAYNLMDGRSVHKDLVSKTDEEYTAWVKLDFSNNDAQGNPSKKYYNENYGYNLEEALAKHPIKELENDGFKANMIDSLKKGNLTSATFLNDGQEEKHFIEANPQFKKINIYDSNMQALHTGQAKSEKESKGQSNAAKQDDKKAKGVGEDAKTKRTAKRTRAPRA